MFGRVGAAGQVPFGHSSLSSSSQGPAGKGPNGLFTEWWRMGGREGSPERTRRQLGKTVLVKTLRRLNIDE